MRDRYIDPMIESIIIIANSSILITSIVMKLLIK